MNTSGKLRKTSEGKTSKKHIVQMTSSHKYDYVEQNKPYAFLGTTLITIPMRKSILLDAANTPLDICIMLDLSESMLEGQKISEAFKSIRHLRSIMSLNDRYSLIGFNDTCDLNNPNQLLTKWGSAKVVAKRDPLDIIQEKYNLSRKGSPLTEGLKKAKASGRTAFYPALDAAIKMFNSLPPIQGEQRRKLAIFITDGGNNTGLDPNIKIEELRQQGVIVIALGVEQSSYEEEFLQKLVGPCYFLGIDSEQTTEALDSIKNCFGSAIVSNAKVVVDIPENSVLKNKNFKLAMVMSKNQKPYVAKMQNHEIPLGDLTLGSLKKGMRLRIFYIGDIDTSVLPGNYPIINATLKGRYFDETSKEEIIDSNEFSVKIAGNTKTSPRANDIDILANSAEALSQFDNCKNSTNLNELRTKCREARQTAELHTTELNKLLIESIDKVIFTANNEDDFDEVKNVSRSLSTQTAIDTFDTAMLVKEQLGTQNIDDDN